MTDDTPRAAACATEPDFAPYKRSQIAELRPWHPNDDMACVSVSAPDREAGSPKSGDMIARNPKNHDDQWLVAAQYFADNFESATSSATEAKAADHAALVHECFRLAHEPVNPDAVYAWVTRAVLALAKVPVTIESLTAILSRDSGETVKNGRMAAMAAHVNAAFLQDALQRAIGDETCFGLANLNDFRLCFANCADALLTLSADLSAAKAQARLLERRIEQEHASFVAELERKEAADAEALRMRTALRKLAFLARTSGGWKRDEELCAACDVAEALLAPPVLPGASVKHGDRNMTEAQIKHMVDRFLRWRLPESFSPDAGISFTKTYNEHTAHPAKHEPTGTNLFDATQADVMVRFMIDDLPGASKPEEGQEDGRT